MKIFLLPALLLGLFAWLLAAPHAHAQLDLVSGTGLRITGNLGGGVQVFAADGTQLMLFDGYRFTLDGPQITSGTATPALTTVDGRPAIRMTYETTGGPAGTSMTSLFILTDNVLRIRFEVQVSSASTPDNTMMRCRSIPSGTTKVTAHSGVWTRASNGGAPFESPLFKGFRYTFSSSRYALLHAPGYLPWTDVSATHLPLRSTGTAGQWTAEAAWVLVENPTLRPHAAAALVGERPLSLDLWTAQPYNLWNSSAAPLALKTQTFNPTAAPRTVTLSWWARDFAGSIVASGTDVQEVAADAVWNRTLSFPAPSRGLLFVEVSATAGIDAVFSRTNLAVLPPHTYSGTDLLFGLANTFQLPDRATELTLLKRMGVRSLRFQKFSSSEAASIGLLQTHHSNNTDWIEGPVPISWIDAELVKARNGNALYWEVSNEMNFTSGIAADYVANFLIPVRNRRDAIAPDVGLTLGGLAGWTSSYLRALYNAGAWDHIDAFAFHPGRGNFTADYPGENGQVSGPNTWNFLGTIRNYKNAIAAYPPKPLHITEVYASTQPNSGWTDSIRNAADSVLLSFALAKQEGIDVMHFYQLNDGVWNNIGGVDPTDVEYYFGMLNRDLSPKPSLLAYATAAENLEGAVFKRWMSFDDSRQHGLMFSTPRGPLAVLWDRSEGYTLTYSPVTAEPWVNRWTSSSALSLPLPLATDVPVAETLHAQTFDNPGPGELNISTKPGWSIYTASTGAATTGPKIQVGGVIYTSPAANNGFVFVNTGLGSFPFPDQGDISLDTIASSDAGRVRLLVRLENGQWYASNTVFTPVTSSSWTNAFANNLEYRRLLRLGLAPGEWSRFNLTPGSPMGLGAALDGDLPALPITGLGWHVTNSNSTGGLTARFDNFLVRGSGGRSLRVLNPLGQASYVPALDGRATVTLDGSPRLVHGVDADAGLDVVMDNAGPAAAPTGTWTPATGLPELYATNYAHDGNTGKGSKTFRFTPHLGTSGTYRVDVWWTAASNRATNVPITVNHAGGASTTVVNQQLNGGRWITLGAYAFNKGFGGNVTISNAGTNGYVVADAVRFVALTNDRDAFTRWAADNFSGAELSDPAIGGPLATPFGDGVSNLLRAALHVPSASGSAGASAGSFLPTTELSNGHLALRYRQRRGGQGTPGVDYIVGGLRYVVEVSDDLVTWRSGADQVALVGGATVIDAEIESVLVRRLAPLAPDARAFLRFRITRETSASP